MITKAIEKIQSLTREADDFKIGADGKEYAYRDVHRVYDDPRPETLIVYSLSGIVDYVKKNIDKLEMDKLMIHVVNHERVDLITDVHGAKNERNTLVTAMLDCNSFNFDRYYNQEDFVIKVLSMFEETEDKNLVIHYVAKVDTSKVVSVEDNGINQFAEIKMGTRSGRTEGETLKPIVSLKPYRTFREVEQPESKFLFRIKDNGGASAALFEADGGVWKGNARLNIATFFKDNLKDIAVLA